MDVAIHSQEGQEAQAGHLVFRKPVVEDGSGIYALVKRCEPLNVNSRYCYLILCAHFASTCAVVEREGVIVGLITAYIPPEKRDTLFVWQVAVDPSMRGQGVATRMLRHLLSRQVLKSIRFVEATVSSANEASRSLFSALAKEGATTFDESPFFDSHLFEPDHHAQEKLIRVGPINPVSKTLIGRKSR